MMVTSRMLIVFERKRFMKRTPSEISKAFQEPIESSSAVAVIVEVLESRATTQPR